MKRVLSVFVAAITVSLSACSTTSFAPPTIELADNHPAKEKSLEGGLEFVSVYIDQYRAAGAKLSNGRQWFDVPGLVGAIGGATAVALGANADVAIGVGALGALTTSAKTYYAPNERADVYYDAVEALTCLRQETIGLGGRAVAAEKALSALKNRTAMDLERLKGISGQSDSRKRDTEREVAALTKRGDQVQQALSTNSSLNKLILDDEYRAASLLKNAVISIENKARVRLADKGAVADVASISALVTLYQKQIEEANKKPPGDTTKALLVSLGADPSIEGEFVINLDELAPKLAQCTLLANG